MALHEKHDVKILSFIFHKWYISSNNFDVNLELSLDWTFFLYTLICNTRRMEEPNNKLLIHVPVDASHVF